jgi:hypothetical protein
MAKTRPTRYPRRVRRTGFKSITLKLPDVVVRRLEAYCAMTDVCRDQAATEAFREYLRDFDVSVGSRRRGVELGVVGSPSSEGETPERVA